jgi:hypothetical protein
LMSEFPEYGTNIELRNTFWLISNVLKFKIFLKFHLFQKK